MELDELATGEKAAAVGGLVVIVGAFLTWVDGGIVAVAGIDGDGIFTLVFGGIVVAIVLARNWERTDTIVAAVLGLLTVLIAGNVYGNIGDQAGGEVIEASAGGGLHLTLLGGLLILGGAVYGYLEERPE